MFKEPRPIGGKEDVSYKTWGVDRCPQCGITFDVTNLEQSPVREGCGHVWCRACFKKNLVLYPNGCLQCDASTRCAELRTVNNKSVTSKVCEVAGEISAIAPDGTSTRQKPTPGHIKQEEISATNEFKGYRHEGHHTVGTPKYTVSNLEVVKPVQWDSRSTTVVEVVQSSQNSVGKGEELRDINSVLPDGKVRACIAAPLPGKKKWKSAYIAEASVVTSVNVPKTTNSDSLVQQFLSPVILSNTPGLHETSDKGLQSVTPTLSDSKTASSDPVQKPASSTRVSSPAVDVEQCNRSLKDSNSKVQQQQIPVKVTEIPDNVTTVVGLDGEKKFKCCVCLKEFKSKSHVRYHKYCGRSDDEKPFKCTVCHQGFVTKSHYEYHVRLHTGERPFACNLCSKAFNQKGKLNRHKQSHINSKPYVCAHCRKSCADRQALTAHYMNVHMGAKRHSCQLCKKKFIHEAGLKRHIAENHDGPRQFVCEKCGKMFHDKGQLVGHLRIHDDSKQFKCDECDKSFTFLKDLRRHKAIHTDIRPFKCNLCSHAFRRKDNLDRHMRQTHCLNPAIVSVEMSDDSCVEGAENLKNVSVASTVPPLLEVFNRTASQKRQTSKELPPEQQKNYTTDKAVCHTENTVKRSLCTEVVFQSPPISKSKAESKELCRILSFSSSMRRSVSDSESGGSGDSGIEMTDASTLADTLDESPYKGKRTIPVLLEKIKAEPSDGKDYEESVLKLTPVRGRVCEEQLKSVTEICFTTGLDKVNDRPVCTFVMNRPSQSRQKKSEAAACPWQLQSFFPR